MKLTLDNIQNIKINDYLQGTLECECGRPHSIPMKKIIVEEGAIQKIAQVLRELGYKKALLVADTNTWKACGRMVAEVLEREDFAFKKYVFIASTDDLVPDETVVGKIFIQADPMVDVILTVGTGVLNDLGKFVSFKLGIDAVIVATAPSMDGFASKGAALIVGDLKTSYNVTCPKVIIGDVNILKEAPMPLIIAGWSDIIGKYSALADWQLSQIVNQEFYCEVTAAMVRKSIKTCMENIEKIKLRDSLAIKNLMEGLVLTGIAMSFVGISRPASGSEHHLSHYWEMQFLFEHRKAVYHGTKVGIGTTITTRLYEMLANQKVDFKAAEENAKDFNEQQWKANVQKYYRQCGDEILALSLQDERNSLENKLHRIAVIRDNWVKIKSVAKTVAHSVQIKEALQNAQAPDKPQDVGIDCVMAMDAIRMAKEVRNRYTILGLLDDLGLLDEFADQIGAELASEV
jgi:glycerol-1-phosphate dehydrogenase [NAD(P)+]